MNSGRLVRRSLSYHWRTNVAVVLGVAAAVSVFSGALLVGDSVRGSLRDIAVGRLGRTDQVVSSTGFFREALAGEIASPVAAGVAAAPMIIADGFVNHEASGRRAGSVLVYGVDARFWTFHGQPDHPGVLISPALAAELAAAAPDVLLVRLQKPSAIPLESLFGRKDDVARTVRMNVAGVLPREQLGEFSLRPGQAGVKAIFAPLRQLQRDLAVIGKVNTVLLANAGDDTAAGAVERAITLEDLGATVSVIGEGASIVVESGTGILSELLESASMKAGAAASLRPVPVFTYLANTIRKADRQIPYSLVTATDLEAAGLRSPGTTAPSPGGLDQIVLNEWAARELNAVPGDAISLDYFLWDAGSGLTTRTARFHLARIVAITGFAADRRLAPDYPGITEADSLSDWDPPFPVDLSRVRPQDEAYWDQYRATPKAFVEFQRGRDLWKTRYGGATSLRFMVPASGDAAALTERFRDSLRASLPPQSMGLAVSAARRDALAASSGATDFGAYFTYFSFFIVVSALLLAILFFRLGVEQRLRQIGVLRASGFTIAQVRRLLLAEALVLASAGSIAGIGGALAYAALIVYGLRTWWIGAVGTTELALHVSWPSIVIGAVAGVVTAAICVTLSLRSLARLTPRALLNAQAFEMDRMGIQRSRRTRLLAWLFAAAGLGMLALGFVNRALQTGMFFGAGAALLAACMFQFSSSLRDRDNAPLTGRGAWALWRLGFRSAAYRPSRSVLSAALIASAAFIIVSVDAFRRGETFETDVHSGTGGFALIARSEVPFLSSPNDAAGREALVVNAPDFSRIRFTRFRLRPGEDASCLNLYRPTTPTIVAPEPGFIESGRFTFAASLATNVAERANPWLLLSGPVQDGVVPVIADATSLQYVLHAAVGDTFQMDTGGDRPLVFRFVGALRDSVLQGELIVSEENFVRLFPSQQGYRLFLIDDPAVRAREQADLLAGTLERELAPFGFDAVSTAERLASFHRVENTYLSTFQALGGLGLLLGTIGLSAIMFRNVLERRRELALLRAVGYGSRRVSTVILAEAALLLGVGLGSGAACAALAIVPAWLGRGGARPGPGLALLLASVAIAGLVSSLVATRAALAGSMLEALRGE